MADKSEEIVVRFPIRFEYCEYCEICFTQADFDKHIRDNISDGGCFAKLLFFDFMMAEACDPELLQNEPQG